MDDSFLKNVKKDYLEECANGMALSLEYACIPENSQERQIISLRKKIFNEEIKKRCLAFHDLYIKSIENDYDYTIGISSQIRDFLIYHLYYISKFSTMNMQDFYEYWNSIPLDYYDNNGKYDDR